MTSKGGTKKKPAQRRDKDATCAALIAAGEVVFAKRSFEGATYDVIAEEANVNKALIAYYFGSKEGFYDSVVATIAQKVIAGVEAATPSSADPVKNFRGYIRALATSFWARPTFAAIIMREYLGGATQERAGPFEAVVQFYRMTERLYLAGVKAGAFRRLDPHALHLSIVSPLIHFTIAASFRRRAVPKFAPDIGDPSPADFAGALEKIILDGVRRA